MNGSKTQVGKVKGRQCAGMMNPRRKNRQIAPHMAQARTEMAVVELLEKQLSIRNPVDMLDQVLLSHNNQCEETNNVLPSKLKKLKLSDTANMCRQCS